MLGEMPSAADVAIFKAQYERALNGLYEAWKFGEMMRILKARMEGDNAESPGSLTRENARLTQPHGGALAAGGWNAGTGLKAWLGAHAREVNYKTAMRFLAIAERVAKVLGEGADEALVRDYLAGKSARQVLTAPTKTPLTEEDLGADSRAEKVASVAMGFVNKLAGIYRTGESAHLSLKMRREIVTCLKTLVRQLEEEA